MPYIEVARNVRLYYEDWGAGPVILFVHGWTISHKVWAYQTLELSHRFRTIALDLRGHGDSDKPLSTYSFPEYAHDLRNFIIALNLWNVTLVGWSMGAAICTEYLKLFGPDRICGFVSVGGAIPKTATGPDWTFCFVTDNLSVLVQGFAQSAAGVCHEISTGLLCKPWCRQYDQKLDMDNYYAGFIPCCGTQPDINTGPLNH